MKAEEEAKRKLEDDKFEARIRADQEKLKQEQEEEERKKKAKEESGRRIAEETKRVSDELKKEAPARKFNRAPENKKTGKEESQRVASPSLPVPPVNTEFRSNSPPVPVAAKKLNQGNTSNAGPNQQAPTPNNFNKNKPPNTRTRPKPQGDSVPNYYVTESRLNLASAVSQSL